ncbi:MAG TPA: hypothetical protein PLK31_17715, partial [Chloroflexota bacterium]|nr:hypothetical protein [Chloroflexota bacterium]
MELLKNKEVVVEPDGRSAIYSHQKSFSPDVHAICHHSGQYLTATETNPTTRLLLREQHDFPGLPRLDKAFKKAAHAVEHEHWVWSKPGIQGTTFLLSGMLLLYLVYRAQQLNAFMTGGGWLVFYGLLLVVAGVGGVALVSYGAYLILQRDAIFHKRAAGMLPAISSFPLECTYEIDVRETIEIELGNVTTYPDALKSYNGRVSATLNPLQNDLETLADYQRQYRNLHAGDTITAGSIAMTGVSGI